MAKHDDYATIEDNCQKFAKYLIEAISPLSFCLEKIYNVLERLIEREFSTIAFNATPTLRSLSPEPNFITATPETSVTLDTTLFNFSVSKLLSSGTASFFVKLRI